MATFNAGAWGIGRDDALAVLGAFLAGGGIASMALAAFSISCLMPFITSQFKPCGTGDRPPVLPSGTRNVAFTVDYSVHSAKIAVRGLPGLQREAPLVNQGKFQPRVLQQASRAMHDGRA